MKTIRSQISIAVISLFLIGFIALLLVVDLTVRKNLQQELIGQLQVQCRLADDLLPADSAQIIRQISGLSSVTHTRITVLNAQGAVIADYENNQLLDTKENHLNRPEVIDALRSPDGFGSAIRHSATVDDDLIYTVYKSPKQRFIRLAHHQMVIDGLISEIRWIFLFAALIIIGLVLLISRWSSRRITRPMDDIIRSAIAIGSGHFENEIKVRADNELGELAKILNEMSGRLKNDIVQLKKMQDIRKDFVANASHELRTPVSSIRGYIETLKDGAMHDEEVSKRFLERTLSNVDRLETIIEDMLDLSQLETRDIGLSLRSVEVKSFLTNIKSDFDKRAEHKGLSLNLDLQSPAGFKLFADPYQFEKAMINLIDNAVKYTDKGAVTIRDRQEQKSYIVTVEDTGTGIPSEDIPRIFERFYRVDKHRSRQLGGSGLGLSIVKHIMELHNGSVRVESEQGKGSKFILRFSI